MEGYEPHLTRGSLAQPDPKSQTASQSPQPFFQNTWSLPADRQTNSLTERQRRGLIRLISPRSVINVLYYG